MRLCSILNTCVILLINKFKATIKLRGKWSSIGEKKEKRKKDIKDSVNQSFNIQSIQAPIKISSLC